MSEARPPIPRPLRREVEVEAGHRCAIPTCRTVPIAHIDAWERVREHTFSNLIALCPTCHTRYDRGEIDRQSMLQYKANLSVIAGRYGDFEQRVLKAFADLPAADRIPIGGGLDLLVSYLVNDGMLVPTHQTSGAVISGMPMYRFYRLTTKGRAFINHWLAADPLE